MYSRKKLTAFNRLSLGSSRAFWFHRRPRGLCSIPFTNFDGKISWRSNSIPIFVIIPFKEEKAMKIPITYLSLCLRSGCLHASTSEPHVTRKCSIRFIMRSQWLRLWRFPAVINQQYQKKIFSLLNQMRNIKWKVYMCVNIILLKTAYWNNH